MVKFLRFTGIVLMGLTATFTIMGGAGTTCVALAAENFSSMAGIIPFKWLYGFFVITTTAIGVMMARATLLLVKRRPNAYSFTLISLILGIILGFGHMAVSRNLRGTSMPVDAVTFSAVLTLVVFLLFRIPGIWEKIDFTHAKSSDNLKAGGSACIFSGLLAFTIQYWMAPTHTINGVNYGDDFHLSMSLIGWGLIITGSVLIGWANRRHHHLNHFGSETIQISK